MPGPTIQWKTVDTEVVLSEIREEGRYRLASPAAVTGAPSLAMQAAGQNCIVRTYIGGVYRSDSLLTVPSATPVAIRNAVGQPLTGQEMFDMVIEVGNLGFGSVLLATDEPNGSPSSPFATGAELLAAIPSPSAMQRVWIVNPCVPCGVSPIVYYPSFGWAPEIGTPVVMVWGNPHVTPLTLAGNTGVQILYASPVIPDALLPARGIYSVRPVGSIANASGIVNCMVGFGLCGDVPAWDYANTHKYPSARTGFSPTATGDGIPVNGGTGLIQNLRIAPDRLTFTHNLGGGGRIDRNSIGPFVAGNNKAYAVFQASKADDSFRFDGFQFNFEGF